MDLTAFLKLYTDPRWPGVDNFLIRHHDGACIFLRNVEHSNMTECSIHATRPQDCREWTPAKERPECRQGLEKWNLHINSSGKIEGTEKDITKFRLFLESIAD
jgi:hypothetical protein